MDVARWLDVGADTLPQRINDAGQMAGEIEEDGFYYQFPEKHGFILTPGP